MPNTLAYVVLLAWPLVVVVLFRRLPLPAALVWSILGGYLFLPPATGFDLPVLPPLDKSTVPSFAAAVMCLLHARKARHARRGPAARVEGPDRTVQWPVLICLGLLAGGIVLTGRTNTDGFFAGPGRFMAGLGLYDIGSLMLNTMVMLLPFLLARRFLATADARETLLRVLLTAALVYSLLILVEVRFSPQLNRWVYGFHAHSFAQQIRFGGFRPTVFIEHGLRVALFVTMALLAAAVLWKRDPEPSQPGRGRRRGARIPLRRRYAGPIVLWLILVLILTKTVGAAVIALLLLPVVAFLTPRAQVLLAATLALAVLVYPMLRGAGLVPTDTLTSWAVAIDEDRAESLAFRFDNEDILLERAQERPLAGWGGWGRNRVYDPRTGEDISVTDGTWIIFIGIYGWIGYIARFGLLTLPIILLVRQRRIDRVTAGLAVVLVANLVDLIPNSGLTQMTWLIAGALSAYSPAERTAEPPPRSARRSPGGGRRATGQVAAGDAVAARAPPGPPGRSARPARPA